MCDCRELVARMTGEAKNIVFELEGSSLVVKLFVDVFELVELVLLTFISVLGLLISHTVEYRLLGPRGGLAVAQNA